MISITGGSGFVGQNIIPKLIRGGWHVSTIGRSPESDILVSNYDHVSKSLIGESVVYLAGLAHARSGQVPRREYQLANCREPVRFAQLSAEAGARQFIYLSSSKVLGAAPPDVQLTENSVVHPNDPYSVSKAEAESKLLELGRECGMQITILRTPAMYGLHMKANLLRLIRAVNRRMILPVGALAARTSILAVENLAGAIELILNNPGAPSELYHVADDGAYTISELVKFAAQGLHVKPRIVNIPSRILLAGLRAVGRAQDAQTLSYSCVLSTAKLKNQLGWQPRIETKDGFSQAASNWAHASGNLLVQK